MEQFIIILLRLTVHLVIMVFSLNLLAIIIILAVISSLLMEQQLLIAVLVFHHLTPISWIVTTFQLMEQAITMVFI